MKSLVPSNWMVPAVFLERLGEGYGRQRAMFHEDHLLLVLHEVPEPGVPERKGVLYWRDPQGEWKTSVAGAGMAALKDHVDAYQKRVDQLEKELPGATTASQLFPILRSATPIRRAAKHLLEVLQAARDAVPDDKRLITLRDRAGDLERASDLLHEEAQHAMEREIAEAGEQQAKLSKALALSSQRLNLLVALTLPATAIASILGMNLRHGLEDITHPLLFWGVAAFGVLFGFFLRGRLSVPED
jgi:Mg2+ and Co2+ transporter CorA